MKQFEHLLLLVLFVVVGSGQLSAQTSKPNILVIMGDDKAGDQAMEVLTRSTSLGSK